MGFIFFAYTKDFTKDINPFEINEKRSQIFMSASLCNEKYHLRSP